MDGSSFGRISLDGSHNGGSVDGSTDGAHGEAAAVTNGGQPPNGALRVQTAPPAGAPPPLRPCARPFAPLRPLRPLLACVQRLTAGTEAATVAGYRPPLPLVALQARGIMELAAAGALRGAGAQAARAAEAAAMLDSHHAWLMHENQGFVQQRPPQHQHQHAAWPAPAAAPAPAPQASPLTPLMWRLERYTHGLEAAAACGREPHPATLWLHGRCAMEAAAAAALPFAGAPAVQAAQACAAAAALDHSEAWFASQPSGSLQPGAQPPPPPPAAGPLAPLLGRVRRYLDAAWAVAGGCMPPPGLVWLLDQGAEALAAAGAAPCAREQAAHAGAAAAALDRHEAWLAPRDHALLHHQHQQQLWWQQHHNQLLWQQHHDHQQQLWQQQQHHHHHHYHDQQQQRQQQQQHHHHYHDQQQQQQQQL